MKIKTLDLEDWKVRCSYSEQLQNFENEFTYPLGDKSFYIRHGYQGAYDYFSFFEQLGEVHYMVVEDDDNKVIGAGCAVLRHLNGENIWYLCDFKIMKSFRGKHILEKMLLKYFFKFYKKSQKMYFVNMSNKKDNRLINRVTGLFHLFPIKAVNLYFFEWTMKEFTADNLNFDDYIILTNKNKKDIVVDSEVFDIYHVIDKNSYINVEKFHIADLSKIKSADTLMYSSPMNDRVEQLLKIRQPSTIGSFVSHRFKMAEYYSVEI